MEGTSKGGGKEKIFFQKISHDPVSTISDVTKALHIPRELAVKTLVFQRKTDKRFIIVALPGNQKLDWKKLSKAAGVKRKDIDLVKKNEIEVVAGLQLGGIKPFGFDNRFLVFFDRGIINNKMVYCSAGTPTESIRIASNDLLRLSRGRLVNICRQKKKI